VVRTDEIREAKTIFLKESQMAEIQYRTIQAQSKNYTYINSPSSVEVKNGGAIPPFPHMPS
jgi:hypothetical protein